MITRVLPIEEWSRLEDIPTSLRTCVVVVEDHGRIVGCWSFAMCVHAEDLWVAADHRRKGAVVRRLLRAAGAVASDAGVQSVCVGVVDAEVQALVAKMGGVALDGAPYVMPLGRFQ